MRDIKFRAWNKDMKKMFKIGQITLKKGTWNYEPENKEYIGMSMPSQPSFVLMQYTGLKDKNGTEIYEGDIVKDVDDGRIGIIKYIGNMTGFFLVCGECISSIIIYVEVIGNAYENPELLEEVK